MAIMHPKDIENYDYTQSEKDFYLALKEQLPDKFQVFYSIRWFETINNNRIDSECDFLIFDPSFGFLTIELKGGNRIEIDDGKWYLIEGNNKDGESKRELKCSPYIQAEKSMRHFYNYFYNEFNQTFKGVYGFAVAFPYYAVNSHLSNEAVDELTIDIKDMGKLPQKINSIFHYWRNRRNIIAPFSQEQRNRFINVINKRISISAAAGALIPIKDKEFSKISFVQDSILDILYNYNQVQIIGGAGTGKTYIAMKKAIRDAINGRKVLLTCCNTELVKLYISLIPRNLLIDCYTYDELMTYLLGDLYERISKNENGVPLCFDLISDIPLEKKYDSIVVDEAQDFDVDMGLSIRGLLKQDKQSQLYVFFDKNQNIFSKNFENAFLIESAPFILRYNIRNTGCIYNFAVGSTGIGADTLANNLQGVEPEYIEFKNKLQSKKTLNNIINRLVNKEYVSTKSMVIISDTPFAQSILSGEDKVGGFNICSKNLKDINDDEICFKEISEFKGLEADVVIYLMHSFSELPDTQECRTKKYVALTRARYYLYILNTKISLNDRR